MKFTLLIPRLRLVWFV